LTLLLLQLVATAAYGQPVILDRQTPLMSVNLVTGPVILYLLGSIAGLRSAHPLAWILGGLAAVLTLPEILGAGQDSAIVHAQRWIIWTLVGPFGGPTNMGVVPPGSHWGPLWLTCALGTLAAAALAAVLAARLRRPS